MQGFEKMKSKHRPRKKSDSTKRDRKLARQNKVYSNDQNES